MKSALSEELSESQAAVRTVIGGFLCAVTNSLKRITGNILELVRDLKAASRKFIFTSFPQKAAKNYKPSAIIGKY